MSISLVSVYLLESQFMEDSAKYFAGVLSAMSCMVSLEVPCVNIMSKMDLVKKGTTGAKRRKDVNRFVCLSLGGIMKHGKADGIV